MKSDFKSFLAFSSPGILRRSVIVCVLGGFAIYEEIRRADHESWLEWYYCLLPLLIGALFMILIWKLDRKEYKSTRSRKSLLPSLISIFLVLGMGIIQVFLSLRDSSPTLMYFSTHFDFNGVSIDFRKDGTYKLGNFCMGVDYTRGNYQLQNDTFIFLDHPAEDPAVEAQRFVIRPCTQEPGVEYALYQTDKEGKRLSGGLVFYLREDHRPGSGQERVAPAHEIRGHTGNLMNNVFNAGNRL